MRKILLLIALFGCAIASAAVTRGFTVTFQPPLTGTPTGYNIYIDDCAATGPVGAPFGTVTSAQTFENALPDDRTYRVCIRPFNNSGELVDPGPIGTLDVFQEPIPGPVRNLDITVECRDDLGVIVDCAAAGVNVTVTIS